MSKFVIHGGKKLSGEISVNGAKNAALKIMAASLLSDERVVINNVPNIEEVNRLAELMQTIGTKVTRDGKKLTMETPAVTTTDLDVELVKKVRVSVLLAGPLLARAGQVKMPHPGGCAIGQRPIDLFLEGFKKFGATIKETPEYYLVKAKKLHGMTYVFPLISVTVTESLMMTACLAHGTTILKNAACEPEIPALAEYLNRCGARITGAGTHTIVIEGVDKLRGDIFEVMPDRIEAASFAILGALAGEDVKVVNIIPEHLDALWTTFDRMGVDYQLGENYVQVFGGKKLKAVDVRTHEYPGFATDALPPLVVLLTQAEGLSLIHETIFEGRLFYTDMLKQMGANVVMCDPHRVIVQGPTPLYGRKVTSPDLRAGFAMILAALVADGESEIDNIYQIDRGYENIEKRLKKIGANIRRVVE
jgi:UDP-N-acetylglucosamine 1-carboxyvinyltransferase